MSLTFVTTVLLVNDRLIVHLPKQVSLQLPSRGMVMIEGHLNQVVFQTPLEPDGNGSHWFPITDELKTLAALEPLQPVTLTIDVLDNWSAPVLPSDIEDALTQALVMPVWHSLTAKAKWEWLRWIRATKNPETRQKRIGVACSKLQQGDRRPCCFDASKCSDPSVSHSGVLIGVTLDAKYRSSK